jgi:hypothetical protein
MASNNLHVGIKIVIQVRYRYLVVRQSERESLYAQVITWVNTILNRIDTLVIL